MQTLKHVARIAASCGVVAACAAALPLTASAHEERELADGRFSVVVGFIDEPAFVGEKNGLSLEVSNLTAPATPGADEAEGMHGGGAPVLALTETLQAEVTYGEETMALDLLPAFGEPGQYFGYFFPTAEGDYTFRIFGEIAGVAVDEPFTSGPETFAIVEPRLEFPSSASSRGGDAPTFGTVSDVSGGSGGSGGGLGGGVALGAVGVVGVGLALSRRGLGRFAAPSPVAARS